MKKKTLMVLAICGMILLAGCTGQGTPVPDQTGSEQEAQAAKPTLDLDWFAMEMTDVTTGETFTINDFAGNVVLVETMAMWCPNCLVQANEVRKMLKNMGNPEDLVVVSLDVDVNEDAATLKKYVDQNSLGWRYVVAPQMVARALGNLYTAEYLNPPLSPMMMIDREGKVHHLEFGKKSAEALQKFISPFLEK